MFGGNFREAYEKNVSVEDAEPEHFEAFLRALYPCKIPPSEDNVLALLKLADRYDVQVVKSMCLEFLQTATGIPLIDRLLLAEKYGGRLSEYLLNDLTDATLKVVLDDPKARQLGPLTRELLKAQFTYQAIQ